MSQLPEIHLESPVKWLKHIEKLDTSVFTSCKTLEREWKTLKLKPPSIVRHYMYVHHNPECKYEILHIRTDRESLDIDRLSL